MPSLGKIKSRVGFSVFQAQCPVSETTASEDGEPVNRLLLSRFAGRFDPSVRSTPGAAMHRARPEEAWWEFRKVVLAALLGSTARQQPVFCKAGMSSVGG